jgi:ATP phosphoribosyltransferase
LEKPTLDFLANSGLRVLRTNPRQYIASIPSLPQIEVLLQRAADILTKVSEGSADLGITGYDIVMEQGGGHDNIVIMSRGLGFGRCELVLAVPESWVDVSSVGDLADLSIFYNERGKSLRIATKYPNLTRNWLYEIGLVHFSLVEAQGALEAAPAIGYADMIADVTTSGTTLRENRLKRISGGTMLDSEACLIGNGKSLSQNERALEAARKILELSEAHQRARKYVSITANIRGESPEALAHTLRREYGLAGLRGPSISKLYSNAWGEDDWYTVTVVVEHDSLVEAVDHLRKAGGTEKTTLSLCQCALLTAVLRFAGD